MGHATEGIADFLKRPAIRLWLLFFIIVFALLKVSSIPTYTNYLKYQHEMPPMKEKEHPPWLIATMSPAHDLRRRTVIRNTWQKTFKNESLFATKFVISNPGRKWARLVRIENATYGDIVILPHLQESAHIANTVKSLEFFKSLASIQHQWQFVSKLDDDSYLDATNFHKLFLEPLLNANGTIIGRTLHHPDKYSFPGGQFYTMTRDLITTLAKLHNENPIRDLPEDILIGNLLHSAGQKWKHIDLPNPIAFDYEAKDIFAEGSAYAAKGADQSAWQHAIGPNAINPHKMKKETDYLKVAACFDERGVIDPGWT